MATADSLMNGARLGTLPTTPNLPSGVLDMISYASGERTSEVAQMIELAARDMAGLDENLPDEYYKPRTQGDWQLTMDGLDVRPGGDITYETVEKMRKSGVIEFATKVRAAGIVAPFRSRRTWLIESPDKKLESYMSAAIDRVIFQMVANALDSMLPYGVSFMETAWYNTTSYDLGVSANRNATTQVSVPILPKPVNPRTIKGIKRDKDNRFNGFVQTPWTSWSAEVGKEIVVKRKNSLVFTYNQRFRNMWGNSLYEPLKDYWFWYQVVLRAMVRFMERIGTPVTVVKAPSKRKVRKPGSKDVVDAMIWGLNVAGQASKSSALVLPSDKDENGGDMWDIFYLTSSESSQPYVDILDLLTSKILQAAVITDTSVTATQNAPYSMARIHNIAKQAQDIMVVAHILGIINDHWLPYGSYYNGGEKGAPLRMYAKMADAAELEELMKLFSVAGNSPFAQEDLGKINYRMAAEDAGIPFLTEEEFEIKKKRVEEERQKALEEQQKAMQQAAGPEAKQAQAEQNKEEEKPQKSAEKIENEFSYFQAALEAGYSIVKLDEMLDLGVQVDDGVIELKRGSFKESQVKRDNRGRFAGRKGGGGGGSAKTNEDDPEEDLSAINDKIVSSSELAKNVNKSELDKVVSQKKPGLFRARNVAIGGTVAGLAILMNDNSGNEIQVQPNGEQEAQDQSKESNFDPVAAQAEIDSKLREIRGRYADNYPNTPEGAYQVSLDLARELGIDEGVIKNITFSYGSVEEGHGAEYNSETGEIVINEQYRDSFDKHMSLGTPTAINLMFHEILHSRQPPGTEEDSNFTRLDYISQSVGINPLNWPDEESKRNFVSMIEGSNELTAHVMTSAYIGRPIDYFEKDKISESIINGEEFSRIVSENPNQPKEFYDNAISVISDLSPTTGFSDQDPSDPYTQGALVYAGLAELKSRREGGSSWDHAKNLHQEGFNYQYQVTELARLFPDKMRDYRKGVGGHDMPSLSTLKSWISEEGVNMEDALQNVTEEALR